MNVPPSDPSDRFSARPALAALALLSLFFVCGYASMNFEVLGGIGFLVVIVSLVMFGVYATRSIAHLARAHWHQALSTSLAAILFSTALWWRGDIFFAFDRLRFTIFRTYYVSALAPPGGQVESRPVILRWGFWGHFLSGMAYRDLVFDERDEDTASGPILPMRIRVALETREDHGPDHCAMSVRRLERHFYLVDTVC